MAKQMTMGVIVGNRGFFPSHLATSGRLEMIAALEAAGIKPIVLQPEETAHGAVETYEDAKKAYEAGGQGNGSVNRLRAGSGDPARSSAPHAAQSSSWASTRVDPSKSATSELTSGSAPGIASLPFAAAAAAAPWVSRRNRKNP